MHHALFKASSSYFSFGLFMLGRAYSVLRPQHTLRDSSAAICSWPTSSSLANPKSVIFTDVGVSTENTKENNKQRHTKWHISLENFVLSKNTHTKRKNQAVQEGTRIPRLNKRSKTGFQVGIIVQFAHVHGTLHWHRCQPTLGGLSAVMPVAQQNHAATTMSAWCWSAGH